MKKKKFLINTFFLTIAALILRSISISFNIYVSNKIGAEGVGLYQLIISIYIFAVTFVSAGITLSVTRVVTDAIAEGEENKLKAIMQWSFILCIVLSLLSAIFLYFFAGEIGNRVLKDIRVVKSLKVLSLSLPFLGVSSCCRGYFFAVRKVIFNVVEQFIEHTVEIITFLVLTNNFVNRGMEYACLVLSIGSCLGEIFSGLFSYSVFRIDIRKLIKDNNKKISKQRGRKILLNITRIAIPITSSSCLKTGLATVENIMVPTGLQKNGETYKKALSGYGVINGMVLPVISFPSAFLVSFSTLLIAELSEANVKGYKNNIRYIIGKVFHLTFTFSILVTGIFLFFGKSLSFLIYKDYVPGIYICLIAPIIPLMYLDSVVDGMLKGLNQQMHYMAYNIIDASVRVILIFVFVPILGLQGFIVVIFASEILNATLSIARLIKVTELKINCINWIIKPTISIGISALISFYINAYLNLVFINYIMNFAIQIFLFVIFYTVLLFITGSFNKKDFGWLRNTLINVK